MRWQDTARRQAGVITTAQLSAAGHGKRAIRSLVTGGTLWRVNRGIYRVAAARATDLTALWIARLATGGIISHTSATGLWRMVWPFPAVVHVSVIPSRKVKPPAGVIVHRVVVPDRRRLYVDGLLVTDRAWSAMDHLTLLPSADASTFADRAFQQGWLRVADVDARLREAPGRTGNRTLYRLARRAEDRAGAESERLLHRLLHRAELTGWAANHPVHVPGVGIVEVDVAFVRELLAVEVDGWAFHSGADRFRSDRRRQNGLVAAGWTVLRFTWDDLVNRPDYVIAAIRRQLEALR